MTRARDLIINGERRNVTAATLAELLAELGFDPRSVRGVAVAVNGAVVPRGEWPRRCLAADDEIELVGAVQGG